jgi:hypothetical protein
VVKNKQDARPKWLSVPRDVFVFVALGPHFNRVGRIRSIGVDGLAFSYAGREELSDKSFEIDIFLSDGDFHLARIPCEKTLDWQANQDPLGFFGTRQCTVRFCKLTQHQISQLKHFIQAHTTKR